MKKIALLFLFISQITYSQKIVASFGLNGMNSSSSLTFYDNGTYIKESGTSACSGELETTVITGSYQKIEQEITTVATRVIVTVREKGVDRIGKDSVLNSAKPMNYLYVDYEEVKLLLDTDDYMVSSRFVINKMKRLFSKIDQFGVKVPENIWQNGRRNVILKKNIKQKLPKKYHIYIPD